MARRVLGWHLLRIPSRELKSIPVSRNLIEAKGIEPDRAPHTPNIMPFWYKLRDEVEPCLILRFPDRLAVRDRNFRFQHVNVAFGITEIRRLAWNPR